METALQIGSIVIFLIPLIFGARLIESSLVHISRKMHVNPFVTGFIVLAIASSLPEISVAVNSAIQGVPDLALGNLFGATIFLLTFVIGSLAIKRKEIVFNGVFGKTQVIWAMLLVFMAIAMITDGNLTAIEGLLLILFYLCFAAYIIRLTYKHTPEHKVTVLTDRQFYDSFIKSIIGVIMLIVFSNLVVHSSINLATSLGISETIIGIVFLGIGTNLPEIVIMLTSNGGSENKLAAGDIIGSAVVNIPTLGVIGVLLPHVIEGFSVLLPAVLFAYFASTGKKLTAREGVVLVALFLIFITYQLITLINS
jgi:cation:H+ antiporter